MNGGLKRTRSHFLPFSRSLAYSLLSLSLSFSFLPLSLSHSLSLSLSPDNGKLLIMLCHLHTYSVYRVARLHARLHLAVIRANREQPLADHPRREDDGRPLVASPPRGEMRRAHNFSNPIVAFAPLWHPGPRETRFREKRRISKSAAIRENRFSRRRR